MFVMVPWVMVSTYGAFYGWFKSPGSLQLKSTQLVLIKMKYIIAIVLCVYLTPYLRTDNELIKLLYSLLQWRKV